MNLCIDLPRLLTASGVVFSGVVLPLLPDQVPLDGVPRLARSPPTLHDHHTQLPVVRLLPWAMQCSGRALSW
jgi:hypothetical protein